MNTKDPPSLCRYFLLVSISTCCLACRQKTRYPLNLTVSPWEDSIANRCSLAVSPWGDFPWVDCQSSSERWSYAAFVILEHSLCRIYYSGSDWYTRIFYPFLFLEQLKVPVVRPFNSQALTQRQVWRQRLPRFCCCWKRLVLSLSIQVTREAVTSEASRVLALQGACCLMLDYALLLPVTVFCGITQNVKSSISWLTI
jgi:hypothetical protein